MFPSGGGQAMASSTQGSQAETADMELQEVGHFVGAEHTPPPQTRPFTGFLRHHHCLLTQSHGGQFSPPTSGMSSQLPKDAASSKKQQSPERGVEAQNPQRRLSNGSQKMSHSERPALLPVSREEIMEARREHINAIPVTSSEENHVVKNEERRNDRGNTPPPSTGKDKTRPTDISGREGSAESMKAKQPVSKYSVMEEAPNRYGATSGHRGTSPVANDKQGKAQQKAGNNYDYLQPGPSTSHHHYRPIVEKADIAPANTNIKPNPSESLRPSKGAKSSAEYDSVNVGTKQARPEAHPFLPSKKPNQRADHPEDIIELQSDVNTMAAKDEKRNKSTAKTEEPPQVTEIPNTNFAIACMVALCFNLPFGVVAMYFSLRAVKAYQKGKAKLGEKRSRWSIVLSLLGITITTVIVSSVVLYTAIQSQKRISRTRAFGARSGLNL